MYKMSNEVKELTQIRKLLLKNIHKNKIDTLCMHKKFTDEVYVIWVSMSDLQESLDLQNFCHVATKKIKSYCNTKHPTKDQIRK